MAKTANYAVNGAATKALQQELKSLQKEPLEGFTVQLLNDNIFEWEVAIFGPPNTLYQGGYFKVCEAQCFFFYLKNIFI